jgi:hypothetical protein
VKQASKVRAVSKVIAEMRETRAKRVSLGLKGHRASVVCRARIDLLNPISISQRAEIYSSLNLGV